MGNRTLSGNPQEAKNKHQRLTLALLDIKLKGESQRVVRWLKNFPFRDERSVAELSKCLIKGINKEDE
jgi:hypothetical protein